jgi:hypothetical protein
VIKRKKRRKSRGRTARFVRRSAFASLVVAGLGVLGFFAFVALDRDHAVAMQTAAVAIPDGGAAAVPPKPEKVKIWFFTQPVAKTELRWGKRKLGVVNPNANNPRKKTPPFFIERPRDSGPMDIVARADGFLPLNTRVYTYNDNKVWLKLVPETEIHTILGYKQAIPDGGADGGADGGVLMPAGPLVGPAGGVPSPLSPAQTPPPPSGIGPVQPVQPAAPAQP